MNPELKVFAPYFKPYKWTMARVGVTMLLAALLEGVGISLFYPLIAYIQQGDAFLSGGSRWFKLAASYGIKPSVGGFIALISTAVVVTLIVKRAYAVGMAKFSYPVMKDVSDEAFRRTLAAHLFHFHASTSARFAQTIENEVDDFRHSINFAGLALSSGVSAVVYGTALIFVSWRLSLIVAALAAARYALVSTIFIPKGRRLGVEDAKLHARMKSVLIAVHQGIDVIKTFATEDREQRSFEKLSGELQDSKIAVAVNSANGNFSEGLLGDGATCLLIYAAISLLGVSGAALLTFLVFISRLIPKISAINESRIRLAEYASRIRYLPQVLQDGGLPVMTWGSTAKTSFDDKIALDDVSFSYPGAAAQSLRRVDLTIRRGETVALVGPSGAGKTTLARLLLRLFDPTSGSVTIDGVPLPDIRRADWTKLVTVVGQDTFLFDDTLENNVKYGAPDCTDEKFRLALKKARAEAFVAKLPEKEKTRLGERGVSLSGGQRQRLAVARAFLRDTPILILDEATSAVDAETESEIQRSIEELFKDRTVVVIAHRLATVRHANRIVVLEAGRVVEEGTHEQLLSQDQLYRRYHDLQLQ